MSSSENLAKNLNANIKDNGCTQKEYAREIDIPINTLVRVLHGENTSLEILDRRRHWHRCVGINKSYGGQAMKVTAMFALANYQRVSELKAELLPKHKGFFTKLFG